MASGIVRCAISSVFEGKELHSGYLRMEGTRVLGKLLLERITESNESIDCFDVFSEKLVSSLNELLKSSSQYRSLSAKRERCGHLFTNLEYKKYSKIWDEFFKSVDLHDHENKQLQQSVTFKTFKMLLSDHFSSPRSSQPHTSSSAEESMSKNELNALQYIGGCIPHVLLKNYQKRSGQKFDTFIECFGNMATNSVDDHEDLVTYTKEWIGKVNRGGLFPLNNLAYIFFIAVKKEVKVLLPVYVVKQSSKSCDDFKQWVIDNVMKNEDI